MDKYIDFARENVEYIDAGDNNSRIYPCNGP